MQISVESFQRVILADRLLNSFSQSYTDHSLGTFKYRHKPLRQ